MCGTRQSCRTSTFCARSATPRLTCFSSASPSRRPRHSTTCRRSGDSHQHIPLSPRAMLRSCWRANCASRLKTSPKVATRPSLICMSSAPAPTLDGLLEKKIELELAQLERHIFDSTWKKVRSSAMCSRDGRDFLMLHSSRTAASSEL